MIEQIKAVSEIKCTPTKVKIRQDRRGTNIAGQPEINLENIRDLIGKPGDITYVNPQFSSFR